VDEWGRESLTLENLVEQRGRCEWFYVRGGGVVLLSIIRKEGGGRLVVFYNVYAHERRDCKFCVWNRVLTAYFFMITLHLANHSHFRMLTSHDGRARRLQESSSNLIKARDARRHASSTHLTSSASAHRMIVRYRTPLGTLMHQPL